MADLPYWELHGSARARLRKQQAPQRKSATLGSRTTTVTDDKAALSGLPLRLQQDVALTIATATALGGAPGHPREIHAAAVLVAAYRAREGAERG